MTTADDLKFRFDWEPAPGVRAPELRATWARLEIWVGDACLTLVEEPDGQSVRRSVYVPLYPMAEWVVYNWWFLKAHSRPASLIGEFGRLDSVNAPPPALRKILEHHSLRAIGEGFVWPNLTIVPEGTHTRLFWYSDGAATRERPLKYLRNGSAWIDSAALEHSLDRFVDAVVTRLVEQRVTPTPLEKEWIALADTNREEAEFCLAAARLGLDPYSEALDKQENIVRAAEVLAPNLIDDFFDAVNPQRLDTGIDWVIESSSHIAERSEGVAGGSHLRFAVGDASNGDRSRPWDIGYSQARRIREAYGRRVDEGFEFDSMMSLFTIPSNDVGLQALGGGSDRSHVLVLGRPMTSPNQRFAQARALWHFVFGVPSQSFLLTPAHTDRQRVERAFAAELLAPAEGIRERLQSDEVEFTFEDVEAIARDFGVSPMVIRHQIENQIFTNS
ncbi:MAG TPA: ImmA/IrrE family metallo-endopeptidase [Actinomycetes bacterium]